MNYELDQTDKSVIIRIQTYSLKSACAKFSENQFQVEVIFKNRLPEKEVFEFELSKSIDPETSGCSFQDKQITCCLTKTQAEQWMVCDIVFKSKWIHKRANKTKNSSDWDQLLKEQDTQEESAKDPSDVFQELYACCDDDAKRAMIKSFTESNGTVLSMNWNEVEKDHVKPFDS